MMLGAVACLSACADASGPYGGPVTFVGPAEKADIIEPTPTPSDAQHPTTGDLPTPTPTVAPTPTPTVLQTGTPAMPRITTNDDPAVVAIAQLFATIVPQTNATYCFDVRSGLPSEGLAVDIYTCNGWVQAQAWQLIDGQVRTAGSWCLDIGGQNLRTPVLRQCSSSSTTQQWNYEGGLLKLGGTDRCVSLVTLPSSGQTMVMATCNLYDSKQWWAIDLSTAASGQQPLILGAHVAFGPNATQCLDQYGDVPGQNNTVDVFSCNNTNAQRWLFQGDTITNKNLCLTTTRADALGSAFVAACTEGNPLQAWTLKRGTIMLRGSNLCLSTPSAAPQDGQQLRLTACDPDNAAPTAAQQWNIGK